MRHRQGAEAGKSAAAFGATVRRLSLALCHIGIAVGTVTRSDPKRFVQVCWIGLATAAAVGTIAGILRARNRNRFVADATDGAGFAAGWNRAFDLAMAARAEISVVVPDDLRSTSMANGLPSSDAIGSRRVLSSCHASNLR